METRGSSSSAPCQASQTPLARSQRFDGELLLTLGEQGIDDTFVISIDRQDAANRFDKLHATCHERKHSCPSFQTDRDDCVTMLSFPVNLAMWNSYF